MAGTIVASTINNDTGVFSTNNAYLGVAKAWVNFGYVGTTLTTNASFNVSSVTRTSTGIWNVNFTTPMTDTNYVVSGACGTSNTNYPSASYSWITLGSGVYTPTSRSTSTFKFETVVSASSSIDIDTCNIVVHGN
jgi:hypothetical protein